MLNRFQAKFESVTPLGTIGISGKIVGLEVSASHLNMGDTRPARQVQITARLCLDTVLLSINAILDVFNNTHKGVLLIG